MTRAVGAARGVATNLAARVGRRVNPLRGTGNPWRRATPTAPVVAAEFDATVHAAGDNLRVRSFGTFGGVFTPSFLTIIGVIMYLRFSWVVGNAGLWQTLIIVVLANAITFITALSVSSIASNEHMDTGGASFMVSRVLGYQAGGGIGIPLFLSQGLSVALYIIGFAESLVAVAPQYGQTAVALVTLAVLTLVALVGSRLMVRVQYLILAVILASFVSIALGFRVEFTNFEPAYLPGQSFWSVFAVFFPAVTGILSGVSMSGDLKDPSRSIPRGVLLAVTAGFVVYMAVPAVLAFSVARDDLWASTALRDASRWPVMVIAGVFGATLSSAIGSLMAAPRTLQALGIDGIVPRFFGRGVGKTQEPLTALVLTIGLSAAAILLGSLNAVAEVLTMFFLTTYGVLNFSAGIEHMVDNPSFRPALRVPWWVSFLGALGCFGVMFLINVTSTVVAVVAVVTIFLVLSKRGPDAHGGVWEGFWTGVFFAVARRLAHSRSGSGKNWRPLIQLFASEVGSHADIMTTAAMLTRHGGALATYAMVERATADARELRNTLRAELESFTAELGQPNIFTTVVDTAVFHEGVVIASQAAEFAAGSYNTVMVGMPSNPRADREFTRMLAHLADLNKNILLFKKGTRAWAQIHGPIVVWWGGQENNVRLMLILAYLLQNQAPHKPPIRLATVVTDAEHAEVARERLTATVQHLRLRAETKVVTNAAATPIAQVLARESADAALVLMGMAKPTDIDGRSYLQRLRETAADMDSALFVLSGPTDVEYV